MRAFAFLAFLGLSACVAPTGPIGITDLELNQFPSEARPAIVQFKEITKRMEPVVEKACRKRSPEKNCDFLIVVDQNPAIGPNAYQTEDDFGRPVLGFTVALMVDVANQDELAFVMGHEAAHHILDHLGTQFREAAANAKIYGDLARDAGADAKAIEEAENLGASLGARRYSKRFELEADHLGALLTRDAGFNAIRGARYFLRVKDPGNEFLGTHPANDQRMATVRAAIRR